MVPILLPPTMVELQTPVDGRYDPRLSNPEHLRIHLPFPPVPSILLFATHPISVPSEE